MREDLTDFALGLLALLGLGFIAVTVIVLLTAWAKWLAGVLG